MKFPNLVGIILGCIVFTLTIVTVVVLLVKSNTIKGFLDEIKGVNDANNRRNSLNGGSSGDKGGKKYVDLPEIEQGPELFKSLLRARKTLPPLLRIPDLQGKGTKVLGLRTLKEADIAKLVQCSNGSPIFSGCAYPPAQVWHWLDVTTPRGEMASASLSDGEFPSLFQKMLEDESSPGARTSNVVMHDLELNHPVGMTQLVNNTTDLSVQVKNLWLTPTRRGQQLAHESLLLLLNWLFSLGYRRIEAPVDAANAIGRKFFERCGFALEAVLRKHRVVANRNRDTALYRLLNSDWAYASMKLYKYLGVTPVAPRFPQDEEDEDEDSEVGSDGSPRVVQGSVAYVGEGEPDAEQKKIQ